MSQSSYLFAQNPGDKVPDRYIIQLKAGVDPLVVAKDHGAAPDVVFKVSVNGFAGSLPAARLKALTSDKRVLAVSPDRVVAAIARGGKPGGGDVEVPRVVQTTPSGVQRIGAGPGMLDQTGEGIGVAVVDTGVDFKHPDLRLGSISFKAVVKGRGMSTSVGPTVGQDDEGHGTHVSGIIAAKNDGYDVVGVAPAATIYAVKVLDSRGSGYDSTVMAGLDWIAQNAHLVTPKIRVVNMSLGRSGSLNDNPAYRESIRSLTNKGITVVVAAGNNQNLEVSQQVPSTYPEVIAIASSVAVDGLSDVTTKVVKDSASYFTSDGAFDLQTGIGVSVSAPGAMREDISGGYLTSIGILSTRLGGGMERRSGTSMASPHAAGVAALIYQKDALVTPEGVRSRLMLGADGAGSLPYHSLVTSYSFDGEYEGVLNAAGALE